MIPVIDAPNTLNMDGAKRLAKRIEDYWDARGGMVRASVHTHTSGNDSFACVRSDMVNGYPRSWGLR